MFIAPDNLHPWCDRREVVGKTMNTQQETKFINYMQRIVIALEKLAEAEGTKVITKQSVPVRVTDNPALDLVDLHHVTYDNDQLGREK